jgi:hypothetical protein
MLHGPMAAAPFAVLVGNGSLAGDVGVGTIALG